MHPERVIVDDKREIVPDTAEEPYAAIAHLEGVGTGFLSKIDNTFVVITAGHCLEEEELSITFGQNSLTVQQFHPLGIQADKVTFGLPSNYTTCSDLDFGIILLKDQNQFIEKNVYLPLEIENGQRPVKMSGYPGLDRAQHGAPGYPTRTQWSIEVTDCRSDDAFLWYRDATTRGNSGSPLFVKQNGHYVAVGIHIAGGPDSNKGIRITQQVIDTMRQLVQTVKARLKSEVIEEKHRLKRILMELADELDKEQRDMRDVKLRCQFAGFASIGAIVGGLVLAPVSLGGSLVLAAGGIAGGAVSAARYFADKVVEKIINNEKLKAVQDTIEKIKASYSNCTSFEGEEETGGPAATAENTMLSLFPPAIIGLAIKDRVVTGIVIDKKSPSEVAKQIREIAGTLD